MRNPLPAPLIVLGLIILPLAGCATPERGPGRGPDPMAGMSLRPAGLGLSPMGEPAQSAIITSRALLANPPARIGADTALAARAVAQVEFAAAAINEPRFFSIAPIAAPALARARDELRGVVGIRAQASPAQAVAALVGAADAVARADQVGARDALAAISDDPAAALARLGALPRMPGVASSLGLAEAMLERLMPNEE